MSCYKYAVVSETFRNGAVCVKSQTNSGITDGWSVSSQNLV